MKPLDPNSPEAIEAMISTETVRKVNDGLQVLKARYEQDGVPGDVASLQVETGSDRQFLHSLEQAAAVLIKTGDQILAVHHRAGKVTILTEKGKRYFVSRITALAALILWPLGADKASAEMWTTRLLTLHNISCRSPFSTFLNRFCEYPKRFRGVILDVLTWLSRSEAEVRLISGSERQRLRGHFYTRISLYLESLTVHELRRADAQRIHRLELLHGWWRILHCLEWIRRFNAAAGSPGLIVRSPGAFLERHFSDVWAKVQRQGLEDTASHLRREITAAAAALEQIEKQLAYAPVVTIAAASDLTVAGVGAGRQGVGRTRSNKAS